MLHTRGKYTVFVIGSVDTGKTSLIRRLDKNEFNTEYISTTGVYPHVIKHLLFYDLSGQIKFEKPTLAYLGRANAFIFCFDLSLSISFEEVKNWIKKIKHAYPETYNQALKILVGNKSDLKKNEELSDIAKKYANINIIKYIETSAKNNTRINEIVSWMPRKLRANSEKCKHSSNTDVSVEKINYRRDHHQFFKVIVTSASAGFVIGAATGGILGIVGVPWTGGLSLLVSSVIVGSAMAILGAVIAACLYIACANKIDREFRPF